MANEKELQKFPGWEMSGETALGHIAGYELMAASWAMDPDNRYVWLVDDYRMILSEDPKKELLVPINLACGVTSNLFEAVFEANEACKLLVKIIGPGTGFVKP